MNLQLAATQSPVLDIPAGQRIPFGWQAAAIGTEASGPTKMTFAQDQIGPAANAAFMIRITVAIDVREDKRLEWTLPNSGRVIGTMEVKYACALQPFEVTLQAEDALLVLQEGVHVNVVQGELPLWILIPSPNVGGEESRVPPTLSPHLLIAPAKEEVHRLLAFKRQIGSLASIQQFGWIEGCVMDGLADLHEAYPEEGYGEALQEHLSLFLPDDPSEKRVLVYENPRSQPMDDRIYGIEATLPFACIAKHRPEHPALQLALDYWMTHQRADGSISEGETISAEGSYTVAYPLAALARRSGRLELAELALRQLRIRRDRLTDSDGVYLRHNGETHIERFRNWARAYAWYMQGLVRTLIELQGWEPASGLADREPLMDEFVRVSELVLEHQHEAGLWACFVDEPDIAADTSGSAGIAAALALGANHGLLPMRVRVKARAASERCREALLAYLTPDGLLHGVAQMNRAGEALQRSDYRVISQMGMGLLAQLEAALHVGAND